MSDLLDEANSIIEKDNISVQDYYDLKDIQKKISEQDEIEFFNIFETFLIRLPEIAEKTGNYNFLEEEDK
tara:strand:- start:18 stop:227 length:210 start_codon:yes stop_codon:yes gene_type:complete